MKISVLTILALVAATALGLGSVTPEDGSRVCLGANKMVVCVPPEA